VLTASIVLGFGIRQAFHRQSTCSLRYLSKGRCRSASSPLCSLTEAYDQGRRANIDLTFASASDKLAIMSRPMNDEEVLSEMKKMVRECRLVWRSKLSTELIYYLLR
jgi:hypothetical protein